MQKAVSLSLKKLLVQFVISLVFLSPVSAEEAIFVRKSGEFTNVPRAEEEVEAVELPALKTQSTEERKAELRAISELSCVSHDGFDCERGADSDGSVICADGFAQSAERYSEFCGLSNITVEYVVEFTDGTQEQFSRVFKKHRFTAPLKKVSALVANVRNLSAVTAKGIEARLYLPYILDEPVMLSGDSLVPEYEVRRLALPFEELKLEGRFHYMSAARFELNCENCKTTRTQR